MLVSAVSASSFKTVFNTRIKNNDNKNIADTASVVLNNTPENTNTDSVNIFDPINEWKNFCHKQILQGKLDIIA